MWTKILLIISVITLGVLIACGKINYKDDNIIENLVEDVIDYKLGIRVDLSPNSPESPDRWKRD